MSATVTPPTQQHPNGAAPPGAVSDKSINTANAIDVSCVKNATDTKTMDYDAKEIIEFIRTDKPLKRLPIKLRTRIEHIHTKFADTLAKTGERKAAKNAVDQEKKQLPAIMWSGSFSKRKSSDLLQHSGLLCADLDELGD